MFGIELNDRFVGLDNQRSDDLRIRNQRYTQPRERRRSELLNFSGSCQPFEVSLSQSQGPAVPNDPGRQAPAQRDGGRWGIHLVHEVRKADQFLFGIVLRKKPILSRNQSTHFIEDTVNHFIGVRDFIGDLQDADDRLAL